MEDDRARDEDASQSQVHFFFSSFFLHFTNDYIQVGYGYATTVPSLLLWCIQGPPWHIQTTLTCQNPKGNTLTGTTGRRRSAEMDMGSRHVKTRLEPKVSFFFCFFSFFIYFTNDFFVTCRLCVTKNEHWHPSVPQLPFLGSRHVCRHVLSLVLFFINIITLLTTIYK